MKGGKYEFFDLPAGQWAYGLRCSAIHGIVQPVRGFA